MSDKAANPESASPGSEPQEKSGYPSAPSDLSVELFARDRTHRLAVTALVVSAIVLVATEWWCASVAGFWQNHPVLAALISNLLIVGVTVLVVDERLAKRRARTSARVAQAAYRELSTVAFDAMVHLARAAGARNPYDLDALPAAIESALAKPKVALKFMLDVRDQSNAIATALAQWAPVMLEHPELAEGLDEYAGMRDALLEVPRAYFFRQEEPNWRRDATLAFERFVGDFALFHLRRKIALGELTDEDLELLAGD